LHNLCKQSFYVMLSKEQLRDTVGRPGAGVVLHLGVWEVEENFCIPHVHSIIYCIISCYCFCCLHFVVCLLCLEPRSSVNYLSEANQLQLFALMKDISVSDSNPDPDPDRNCIHTCLKT